MKKLILICLLVPMLAGCIPVQKAVESQFNNLKVCLVDLVASKDVEATKTCFAEVAIAGGSEILLGQLDQYLADSEMEFVNMVWAILRPLIPNNIGLTSYAYEKQEDARELILEEFRGCLSPS